MTASRAPSTGRVRLGEILVKAGVITSDQLKAALHEQTQWGGKIGEILVRMKFLTEDIFVRALSKQLGLNRTDLAQEIPPDVLSRIPAEMAEEYEILPIAIVEDGRALAVATADPINVAVLDHVRSITKMRVVPYVAGMTAIRTAIARLYQGDHTSGPLEIMTNAEDAAFGASMPPKSAKAAPAAAQAVTDPGRFAPSVGPLTGEFQALGARTPTPLGTPAVPGAQGSADAQRRDNAALKALIELLVHKGVITLDEYLARLKR